MSAAATAAPAPQPWSEAELAFAADLWTREGRSATEIVEALAAEFGTVRSSGNLSSTASRNRDLFPARGAGHRAAAATHARKAVRLTPAGAVLSALPREERSRPQRPTGEAAAYDAAALGLRLDELSCGQCRWPVNEPEPGETHLFCGHAAQPGRTYCDHHAARASGGFWCAGVR